MIISKEEKYRALKNQGRDVMYLLQIEKKTILLDKMLLFAGLF